MVLHCDAAAGGDAAVNVAPDGNRQESGGLADTGMADHGSVAVVDGGGVSPINN